MREVGARLSNLSQNLAGTANDLTVNGFAYNPASQIKSLTRSNDTYAWNGHYNITRPYTVNGLNQDTAAGAASFSYDSNGNLTGDGSSSFTYDPDNRLVGASGAKSAALVYDGVGRLFESSGGSAGLVRLLYDGSDVAIEYGAANTRIRRYVYGPGTDEPLVWYEGPFDGSGGTTDRRWLHPDERGSVIALSDGNGNVLNKLSYDEYGIPAATNMGRFQYTGQAWAPELGMYYYKARMYSPTLGRFMQSDPIGYGDGMNLYN